MTLQSKLVLCLRCFAKCNANLVGVSSKKDLNFWKVYELIWAYIAPFN